MKIMVLNPNTSTLVTEKVENCIRPIVKEGVEVKAENQTLATVTLQNFFRLAQ